ncbi:unnamed protein product, partial [Ectocarpus sp. 12 AP-2014]
RDCELWRPLCRWCSTRQETGWPCLISREGSASWKLRRTPLTPPPSAAGVFPQTAAPGIALRGPQRQQQQQQEGHHCRRRTPPLPPPEAAPAPPSRGPCPSGGGRSLPWRRCPPLAISLSSTLPPWRSAPLPPLQSRSPPPSATAPATGGGWGDR